MVWRSDFYGVRSAALSWDTGGSATDSSDARGGSGCLIDSRVSTRGPKIGGHTSEVDNSSELYIGGVVSSGGVGSSGSFVFSLGDRRNLSLNWLLYFAALGCFQRTIIAVSSIIAADTGPVIIQKSRLDMGWALNSFMLFMPKYWQGVLSENTHAVDKR